jgi:hypothetical protein
MIRLHSDYLAFEASNGEAFPCSVEEISVELIGKKAASVDPHIIQNAAKAVLHYYTHDLGKTTVKLEEFSAALAKVLRTLGVPIQTESDTAVPGPVIELNLAGLMEASHCDFELAFFPRLRDELRSQMRGMPKIMRFTGLRSCVKILAGVKRWNGDCQQLSEQIIQFLRQCYHQEAGDLKCMLVVQ